MPWHELSPGTTFPTKFKYWGIGSGKFPNDQNVLKFWHLGWRKVAPNRETGHSYTLILVTLCETPAWVCVYIMSWYSNTGDYTIYKATDNGCACVSYTLILVPLCEITKWLCNFMWKHQIEWVCVWCPDTVTLVTFIK